MKHGTQEDRGPAERRLLLQRQPRGSAVNFDSNIPGGTYCMGKGLPGIRPIFSTAVRYKLWELDTRIHVESYNNVSLCRICVHIQRNLLFQASGLSSLKREQRRGLAWRRRRVQHVLAHELQPQLQTPISGRTAPHRMKAVFVQFDTPFNAIFPLIVRRQPIGTCTRLDRKTQRTHTTRLRANRAISLRA